MKIPFFNKYHSQRERQIAQLLKTKFKTTPRKIHFYCQACCHKSAARNIHNNRELSNERLEFLGDAIIDSIIADYLYAKHPKAEEGEMTKMKSRIVSRANLNQTAVKMGIDELLETDLQAASSRTSIAGNAFEAIIGAIYLDRGYMKSKKAVLSVLGKYVDLEILSETENDYKSRLYEQAHRLSAEVYFKTEQIDSQNGKYTFYSTAIWNGKMVGSGSGSSKKKAEQKASKQAFYKINN